MRARRCSLTDEGASDLVGTLLMVAVVVAAGGGLVVLVGASLDTAAPAASSFALSSLPSGATSAGIIFRNGEPIALKELRLTLQRNESAPIDISHMEWITADPEKLRAGDTLRVTLTPAAGKNETLRLRLVHTSLNVVLADLQTRTPTQTPGASPLGTPTLTGSLTPPMLIADGSATSLLTVRIAHPAGALNIATVIADISNLTLAAGAAPETFPLEATGDGVWSGRVRAPLNTSLGTFNITVNATDLTGRQVGSTVVPAIIAVSGSNLIANLSDIAGTIKNMTNFTGNFSGQCYGCIIFNGIVAIEGTRIIAPTSENVSDIRLNNWTWDRQYPARIASDAMLARIVSETYAWTVYIQFNYPPGGPPGIKKMGTWNSNTTTTWIPANGAAQVNLQGLNLNLTDPTQNGFACSTTKLTQQSNPSVCDPPMTYQRADIRGRPTFVVAWLRDETNNFQVDEVGIFSADVVAR